MRHDWRVTEADFERAIGGKRGWECGSQTVQANVGQGSDCRPKSGQEEAKNAAHQWPKMWPCRLTVSPRRNAPNRWGSIWSLPPASC